MWIGAFGNLTNRVYRRTTQRSWVPPDLTLMDNVSHLFVVLKIVVNRRSWNCQNKQKRGRRGNTFSKVPIWVNLPKFNVPKVIAVRIGRLLRHPKNHFLRNQSGLRFGLMMGCKAPQKTLLNLTLCPSHSWLVTGRLNSITKSILNK